MKIVPKVKMVLPIFLFAVTLWFSGTWYFGWNIRPKSDAERFFDNASFIIAISSLRFWIEVQP